MARVVYYVVVSQGEWQIKYGEGKIAGPYATQKAAIRAAVDAAHSTGKNGHDAQVLVQGSDSKWQTEWTYGNDPYPPRG